MNKKAQEMNITTLILLVLGVVVLIVLVLGFTKGWDSYEGIFKKRNLTEVCEVGIGEYAGSIKLVNVAYTLEYYLTVEHDNDFIFMANNDSSRLLVYNKSITCIEVYQ